MQDRLASMRPSYWEIPGVVALGGTFVCFRRGGSGRGAVGDPGWAAAVVMRAGVVVAETTVSGSAGAGYVPGALAAREGRLLATAVGSLDQQPDVLLVNATGTDHPRRAGLALHLGWSLGLPSVGVTDRPLLGGGPEPGPRPGDRERLVIGGQQVGWILRTRARARPVVVSPGWRTSPATAVEVVLEAMGRARTPEPVRQARRLARTARARR